MIRSLAMAYSDGFGDMGNFRKETIEALIATAKAHDALIRDPVVAAYLAFREAGGIRVEIGQAPFQISAVSAEKPRPCPHGKVWLVGKQICTCESRSELGASVGQVK